MPRERRNAPPASHSANNKRKRKERRNIGFRLSARLRLFAFARERSSDKLAPRLQAHGPGWVLPHPGLLAKSRLALIAGGKFGCTETTEKMAVHACDATEARERGA